MFKGKKKNISRTNQFAIIAVVFGTLTAFSTSQASATSLQLLHAFENPYGIAQSPPVPNEGGNPQGALVTGSDGNYYGVLWNKGDGGFGTIFKMTPTGTLTVLHAFDAPNCVPNLCTNADGAQPDGGLVVTDDGSFLGTTAFAGTGGNGTIYKITPDGTFTILHAFSGFNEPDVQYGTNADGAFPFGTLVQGPDDAYYGITEYGGINGKGVFFRITADGLFTVICAMTGSIGEKFSGSAPVLGNDGNFYGAFDDNYSTGGYIYKITLQGSFSKLYSFTGAADGGVPDVLISARDGNLYGATRSGGANGTGTLFKLTLQGVFSTLHAFDAVPTRLRFDLYSCGTPSYCFDQVPMNNIDGTDPVFLMQAADGNLYGSNFYYGGGASPSGTLFRWTPDGEFSVPFAFGDSGSDFGSYIYPVGEPTGISDDGQGGLLIFTQESGSDPFEGWSFDGAVLRITLDSPLTVNVSFNPSEVWIGQATQLKWSSTNAQSCKFIGYSLPEISGSAATSGTKTIKLLSRRTFNPASFAAGVECISADGHVANATAKFTIKSLAK